MPTKWITGDVITFARMNTKTLMIQAAEPAIMYAGMYWVDTDDNMSYQRNAANTAWHTILKEELAFTITGLHTFDRGAAPPFAVNAAATRVVDLIADVHAPEHKDGGADELDVSELAGAIGGAGEIPETDGAAVTWVEPDGRYDPKAHVLATTGPHNAPLPLIDLEVGVQGEVIHRGAADWEALAVGAAGEVIESGGAAADVSWVEPDGRYDPKAHVLATTGPHTGTLPLTDLVVGARGEVIIRGAADWEALGVGAALQALLSGGAGADPYWGAPTPAAHVLATTGPHTGTLPLADLAVGARGELIARGAADWEALGVGAAGQALLSGGAGADVVWGAPAPAAHESTHVKGGADDIDGTLDGRAIAITTQGDIVHGSAANTINRLAAGTVGQTLQTGGAGANPSWTWDKRLDAAPDANISGNGITVMAVAGEEVDGGEICYMKADGKYWLSDADGVATMPAVVMATTNIAADATGLFLHIGYYRHDTWNWTLGNGEANLLWAGVTPGAMSPDQPVGAGDQVQVVAYIVTADIVFFNPSYELVEVPA